MFSYEVLNKSFSNIMVENKPVQKSFLNALNKAKETTYWKYCEPFTAQNPFSGVEVELITDLEASIYTWTLKWYSRYEYQMDTEVPVSTYDNMRYLFMALNPSAYMDLLD
jgi:hypothetical protein